MKGTFGSVPELGAMGRLVVCPHPRRSAPAVRRDRNSSATVSVYAEMLKMALEADEHRDSPVPDLIAEALSCRVDLDCGGDAASRLARALAYDVALVRLCERLGLPHDMMGPMAGPSARRHAERALAGTVPDFSAGLRHS